MTEHDPSDPLHATAPAAQEQTDQGGNGPRHRNAPSVAADDPHGDRLDVIYNDTCPICSREVSAYAARTDDDVVYHGLSRGELERFGLDADSAAREFHVMYRGELISGLAAFALLWERLPRMRWLAGLVRWPVVGPVADLVYRRVLAPLLYAMHRRRQAKARKTT